MDDLSCRIENLKLKIGTCTFKACYSISNFQILGTFKPFWRISDVFKITFINHDILMGLSMLQIMLNLYIYDVKLPQWTMKLITQRRAHPILNLRYNCGNCRPKLPNFRGMGWKTCQFWTNNRPKLSFYLSSIMYRILGKLTQ